VGARQRQRAYERRQGEEEEEGKEEVRLEAAERGRERGCKGEEGRETADTREVPVAESREKEAVL
jgi:hypothetical protein